MRGVLREAARLGLGGECASLQEAKHCLSLGKGKVMLNRLGKSGIQVRSFLGSFYDQTVRGMADI